MRESNFIRQNKEKWAEYEKILELKKKDPDALSDLYVQVTDDLSYARTFYPNRSVRVYLNNLAQKIHASIYKNKREKRSKLVDFWIEDLPRIIYESRKSFYLSFIIFGIAALIGVFSTMYDIDFPKAILGDSYVEMTEENIAKNDPMAVYKGRGETEMFLQITLNNLFVAFYTFMSGLFFGIGTVLNLIRNGVMVGTFQYWFSTKGLLLESSLTIWMHGTLEISAIIFAGAAGFELSRGLVFPGTLRRLQAFQLSARRGMKIMIGIAPIFVIAGFIEGFITRHTEVPNVLRFLAIMVSLTFVVGYFMVYPWYKNRKGFSTSEEKESLPFQQERKFDLYKIKTVGDIFSDTFSFLNLNLGMITKISAFVTLVVTIGFALMYEGRMVDHFYLMEWHWAEFFFLSNWNPPFENFFQYFNYDNEPWLGLLNIILYSVMALVPMAFVLTRQSGKTAIDWKEWIQIFKEHYWKALVLAAFMHGLMYIPFGASWILFFMALPIFALLLVVAVFERKGIIESWNTLSGLLNNRISDFLMLYFMLLLFGVIFLFLISSPLLWLYYGFIDMNISLPPEQKAWAAQIFYSFIAWFGVGFFLPVIYLGFTFQYFSFREIIEANSLRKRLTNFGAKTTLYGMEKES